MNKMFVNFILIVNCIHIFTLMVKINIYFQMEADIDGDTVAIDGNDKVQRRDKHQIETMEHYQVLTTSTPVCEKDDSGYSKQMPTLQSNDSGFSDTTFISTPASIREKPCSSLVSSISDMSECSALLEAQRPSLSNCDVSPIQRKSSSHRTRRNRLSDPGFQTLAMRMRFFENNNSDNFLKRSQSSITSDECGERNRSESVKVEAEDDDASSYSIEQPLRMHLFRDKIDRSRSSSQSLSCTSDELEASFQSMSLEESSSESRTSPASLSSSPSFVFPAPHLASQSHSSSASNHTDTSMNQQQANNFIEVSTCDKKQDNSIDIRMYNTDMEEECKYITEQNSPFDKQSADKFDFVTKLSLTPTDHAKCSSFQNTSHSPCLSKIETVSAECHKSVALSVHTSRSKSETLPDNTLLHTSLLPASDKTSLHLLTSSSLVSFETSHNHSPIKSSQHEISHLKSPSKRLSQGFVYISTTPSPLKMRRRSTDLKRKSSIQSIKRDLSEDFLSKPPQTSTSHHLTQSLSNSSGAFCNLASSSTRNPYRTPHANISVESSTEFDPFTRLETVIKMYSPAEPSRLIGRRVGLVKCDIVGELSCQNFVICLRLIFQYLTDTDIVRYV